MTGPFEGLRVVEFGRFIAAPYAAQLLADGGASVTKVEPLGGDNTRQNNPVIPGEGRQYLNKNRGKRSLAVDLGNDEVLAGVRKLVEQADIVIANFRPGIADRLGLDYETVSGSNPRVIYAENTAYGPEGPLAGSAGMDIALQAYSGFAPLNEQGPRPLEFPAIDYAAALLIAWGISTALYHRERTGDGQKLDVSLLQAALVLQNNLINHIDAADEWRHEYVEYLKTAFSEGKSWDDVLEHRDALSPWAAPRAYYGFFQTADGTIALAAAARPLQQRLVTALEVDDPFPFDPDSVAGDLKQHMRRVHSDVSATLRAQTTEHWLAVLAEARVPASEYQTREEAIDSEQAWANDYLVRLDHELLGGITVVAPPVQFSETPLEAHEASPILGKHTRELLAEAGLATDAIERLVELGAVVSAD